MSELTPDQIEQSMSYKLRHEQFVSGLSGGDVMETYIVTLVTVSSYVTWIALDRIDYFKDKYAIPQLLTDFALLWIGPLMALTVYSSAPVLLNILLITPGILILSTTSRPKAKATASSAGSKTDPSDSALSKYLPRKSSLTCYRAGMMVVTCLAILAVDFKEFPRRFAKVETWGTSLMDLGVGSFVFSMGVVSARAKLVDAYHQTKTPLCKRFLTCTRQSAAVLLLGAIRLLAVKSVEYHEHVTEYGVHWNFFVTLGLLPPFECLFDIIGDKIPCAVGSLIVGGLYELALDQTDLGKFVLTAPRTDLISQNKEGIFSFFGYLSIFLAGKSTGFYVLPAGVSAKGLLFPSAKSNVITKPKWWNSFVPFVSALIYGALYLGITQVVPVSRRLANLSYVLWVVSFNSAFLGLFELLRPFSTGRVPVSLQAVNTNGLAVFLVANLLTGLINMSIKTLDSSRVEAMSALSAYALALFAFAIILYAKGIRIKI
uniref:GPI-anchored wall transfer protein n=1 Tax=Blastobotrys adeninivorans TaxID=409370 RepID=A0A060T7E6_BLAAD